MNLHTVTLGKLREREDDDEVSLSVSEGERVQRQQEAVKLSE